MACQNTVLSVLPSVCHRADGDERDQGTEHCVFEEVLGVLGSNQPSHEVHETVHI